MPLSRLQTSIADADDFDSSWQHHSAIHSVRASTAVPEQYDFVVNQRSVATSYVSTSGQPQHFYDCFDQRPAPATTFYVASTSVCQCCGVQRKKKNRPCLAQRPACPSALSWRVFLPHYCIFGQLCVCTALLNCIRGSQFKSVMDAEGSAQPFLRKARSDVWAQFTRKKDVARCNLCRKEYKYTSSTSNLQKHLRTAHPDVWKEMDHDTLKTKPITSWVGQQEQ